MVARVQTNLKLKTEFRRDVVSRACYRARRGKEIADRLKRAGLAVDSDAALIESDMLRRCASLENIWTATDLETGDGELYEGHGTLWSCNGRLCPSCLASRRRRMRKHVRDGIARVQIGGGERWRLVTLTCPTMAGVSLLNVRAVFNRAWSLLRKLDWWRNGAGVRAGVKGEEFTIGDEKRLQREGREWDFARDGFHFHVHVLVCSRWVEWTRLGEEWTACLETAAREQGIALMFSTTHGRAVVDVRLVTNQKIKGKRTISIDGAVEEVSKYITKSESWLKVSDAQLVEVASVPRWFRAVELLGDCREKRTEQQKALDKAQRAAREREACWRAEVERTRESLPVAERLEALEAGAELTTRVEWVENDEGKLEQREAVAIDDFKLAATVRAEIAVIGELEPRTLAALKARTAYLDTKNLSDGGDGQAGREIMSLRRRSKPLRVLARGAPRDRWLEGLDGHVNQVQAWRRADLRTRYLYAKFSTLDGGLFYGLRAVSASQFSSHRLVAV